MNLILATSVLLILFATGLSNPVLIYPVLSELDILPAGPSPNCPPGYSQPAISNWDKCYKVYTNFKSRKDAATQCKRDNGTLPSVSDAFVNSYLYSLASQSTASSLWLGVQCFSNDPTSCVNDDGIPFNFNNFNLGQPTSNDICVYMSTIGRDSQKWSTFDCEQNFQFACEANSNAITATTTTVSATTTTTVSPTTTYSKVKSCPTGFNAFNGTCYNIIYSPYLSYESTKELCQQTPGGNIVSIPTKEVNDFLNTMPTACPHAFYVQIGLKCPNITYAGDVSSCVWDDGTPFGYNGFKLGEPSTTSTCAESQLGEWNNDFQCNQLSSCGACQVPMS